MLLMAGSFSSYGEKSESGENENFYYYEGEPVYIRKGCFNHLGGKGAFYMELVKDHSEFFGPSVFPLEEIPEQYWEDGLSVYISGNVISYRVSGGCSEPNIRLAGTHLFELKLLKNND